MFKCQYCDLIFIEMKMKKVHERLHCVECKKWFANKKNLCAHERTHASTCTKIKPTAELAPMPSSSSSVITTAGSLYPNFKIIRSAFQNRIQTFSYTNRNEEILLPQQFFSEVNNISAKILSDAQEDHITFKYNMELVCDYIKIEAEEEIKICTITHHSKMTFITLGDEIEDSLKHHSLEICTKMSEFQERDSGWTLITIKRLNININRATFIRGSGFIPLPKWIQNKKACFNMQNSDDFCFKWCIIASFSSNRPNIRNDVVNIRANRINVNSCELNFDNLEFPMKLKEIKKFEEQNSNISINVFGCEGKDIVGPYYLTSSVKENHINLLLLTEEDHFHYVLITDISR